MHSPSTAFYVTGGTLRADAPSYVERSADRELLEGLLRGEFCYVLTSRQMGKSSLMVRTMLRLRERGVHVAALDLTAIGQNLNPDQWYDGLLLRLGRQVDLEPELERFWEANPRLGPCQRFFTALHEGVLPRLTRFGTSETGEDAGSRTPGTTHKVPDVDHAKSRLVIFVDEIDAVRSLPFSTDEFFAAIRECHNRRTQDPELNRITFCLLGVATPTDLITDPQTTPFNVGRRVELNDFSEDEAAPLTIGLQPPNPSDNNGNRAASHRMLQRILYWTGGHPYLTQRLCRTAAEAAGDGLAIADWETFIDRHCTELYLSSRARERDDNLIFVRDRILRADTDVTALLELYRNVHAGKPVPDDPANPLISVLRLSGIIRVSNARLHVRNRIYGRVFDRAWVTANMPGAELRRQHRAYRRGLLRGVALAGLALLLGTGGLTLHRRAEQTRRVESAIAALGSVYRLLDSYQDRAIVHLDMGMEGAGLTAHGECSILFERPNRFQLETQLRLGLMETELRIISDGTNAWVHLPALNQYLVIPAPLSMPELAQAVGLEWLLAAPLTLYGAITSPETHGNLTAGIDTPIMRVHQEPWETQPACLLAFKRHLSSNTIPMINVNLPHPPTGVVDTQLRLTTMDGLIREISLDLSQVAQRATIPQLSGGAPREVLLHSFVVTSRHDQIQLNQPIPPETFRFVPPPNAQEVTSIDAGALFSAGLSTDTEPLFDPDQLSTLIPPRDPDAGPQQIDLSPHYNAPLTEPWHSALDDNDLSDLPRGLQLFGGVRFDVRGIVQLAGTAEPYLRRLYPTAVRGIRIEQRFNRLHLLHATGWNAPDGTHVANLLLHYADGERRILPIFYGYDVRNWWPQPGEPRADITGLGPAWERPGTPDAPRRLFISSWDNPRPHAPVSSIDYVSALDLPAPFLIAITIEGGTP